MTDQRTAVSAGCQLVSWLTVSWCLLLGLLAATSMALDPSRRVSQYAVRQWGMAEGLPYNTVRAVAQTQDGLLWLGTPAGLVRFDGVEFDVISGSQYGGLKRTHVAALVTDAVGDLWIGTAGDGLWRLTRAGAFHRMGLEEGLPTLLLLSLAIDDEGLWVGTKDAGIMHLGESNRFWRIDPGVSSYPVHGLAPDGRGGCWFATAGAGVFHASSDGIRSFDSQDGLPSDMVWGVALDHLDRVWVATTSGVAFLENETWQPFERQGVGVGWTQVLHEDQHDQMWFGFSGDGLGRSNAAGIDYLLDAQGAQLKAAFWTLFEDREGHLWAGTLGQGLLQIFAPASLPIGRQEGLADRRVLALVEGPQGDLWVSTKSFGVQRFDPDLEQIDEPWTTADGLSGDGGWSLDFAADGSLLFASLRPGVDRLRLQDGHLASVIDLAPELSQSGRLFAVLAVEGGVWVGTGLGLVWVGDDGMRRRFTTADGLPHNQALTLVEHGPGALWVGGTRGLSLLRDEQIFPVDAAGYPEIQEAWTLLGDEAGNLWVGTFGRGLFRVEEHRVVGHLDADQGLPSNDITAILPDDHGFLWLGTTRGIVRVAEKDLLARIKGQQDKLPLLVLDQRDGLRSAEVYGGHPRAIRSKDGLLWFATLDSVVRIDPTALDLRPPPAVRFREVLLDGEPIDRRQLELPPEHRTLELRYSADSLRSPTRVRFRHRVLGLDDRWREVGTSRAFSVARLSPGKYRFEVQASDDRGNFEESTSTTFQWTVKPRFVQTRIFGALVGLALVGLGFSVQQLRVRRLWRREEQLRSVADEAVANVRTLRGLLPICASCNSIREDSGKWQQLEDYIDEHSEAQLTHGYCPTCSERFLSDLPPE